MESLPLNEPPLSLSMCFALDLATGSLRAQPRHRANLRSWSSTLTRMQFLPAGGRWAASSRKCRT